MEPLLYFDLDYNCGR